jgi:hypothetical protein
MSFLDDLVSISISASTKTPTRPGFGTPLLLSQEKPAGWGSAKAKSFADTDALITAGFTTNSPVYKAAVKVMSQDPAPDRFKVGIRALTVAHHVTLVVTIATEGYVYDFTVDGVHILYTVLASATTSTVATALALLITGGTTGATATASTATITVIAAAGKVFDVSGHYENGLTLTDTTTDPGIATDLAAIYTFDSDWYGLVPDHFGKAEALAAAAWIETHRKIMVVDTADTAVMDSGSTTDILYALNALAYTRTAVMFSRNQLMHYQGAAWQGSRLPQTPGSDTWKFNALVGCVASNFTSAERDAILAKKGNDYIRVAGIDMTEEGWSVAGEFMDTVRFIDWLQAEGQIRIFGQLTGGQKIPYTDAGITSVCGTLLGALYAGVKAGGLAKDPEPTITAPKVDDIDVSDRAARLVEGIEFTGRLAGAIHKLKIKGRLTV